MAVKSRPRTERAAKTEGKLKELEQTIQGAEEELTSHYKNASGNQNNRSMIGRFNAPQR